MVFKQQRTVWKLKKNELKEPNDSFHSDPSIPHLSNLADEASAAPNADVGQNTSSEPTIEHVSQDEDSYTTALKESSVGDKSQSTYECRVPLSKAFFNPNLTAPVVDGESIALEPKGAEKANWRNLPYRLRNKRADIFVDLNSKVEYLPSLLAFLKTKQFDVKPYDDTVHYLPSDILLVDETTLVDAGTLLVLQKGKRYIWEELKKEFGTRLNDK